jgi:tRNA-splicing endonuclease subunit Sen34
MEPEQVRISKIAGRYLVFDSGHVAVLRRRHNICSVLVGTAPQNPSQSIYLGLPLELLPEEVDVLVATGAGYIANEAAQHLRALREFEKPTRRAYVDLLRRHKLAAQATAREEQFARQQMAKSKVTKGRDSKNGDARNSPSGPGDAGVDGLSSSCNDTLSRQPENSPVKPIMITPTTSRALVSSHADVESPQPPPRRSALFSHLHAAGYFMTPGLRFGACWSVYPGDPLRYHAHFLAHEFGWDEKLDILDLVSRARLGTAVKKSYLIGGAEYGTGPGTGPESSDLPRTRAFCIEWAGM